MKRSLVLLLLVMLALALPTPALASNTVASKGPTCNATADAGGFDSENNGAQFGTYTNSTKPALTPTPPDVYIGFPDGVYSCWSEYDDDDGHGDFGGRGIFNFSDTTGPNAGSETIVQAAFYLPEGTVDAATAQLSILRWDAFGHNGCDSSGVADATNLPANGLFINESDDHLILATEYDSNTTADPSPCNNVVQNLTETQTELLDYGDADPLEGGWFTVYIRQQLGTSAGSSGADGLFCADPSSPYVNVGACQHLSIDAAGTSNDYNGVNYDANLRGEAASTEYHDRLRAGVVATTDLDQSNDLQVYLDQVKVTNQSP